MKERRGNDPMTVYQSKHELLSAVDGEVREVAVAAGTQVAANDLLIDIAVNEHE